MSPKLLARKILPKKSIRFAEETYRKGRVYAFQARNGFPAKNLKVIAVTGTNGKTTTCNFINVMLKSAGYKTALFTTVNTEIDGIEKPNTMHRTVPPVEHLLHFLRDAKEKKADFVILETTAHALDQHKLIGIPIEVAVMTNFTQDHLDYFGSMSNYSRIKARLFNSYMKPKHCVLNRDDLWYPFFKKQSTGKITTYGMSEKSVLQASKLSMGTVGSNFTATYLLSRAKTSIKLMGEFNVYNALAAILTGRILGLSLNEACIGVSKLGAVSGRMEAIDEGQNFKVLVDYAHTPDALEKVLATCQETAKGRVLLVFGATGDRDKTKRPIMGRIAANQADEIFLTDDEPYTENPKTIRKAVLDGIVAAGGANKTTEVSDRKEAIAAAFASAKKDDVVLLAGIGHQNYRAMNDGDMNWDERQVAKQLLQKK